MCVVHPFCGAMTADSCLVTPRDSAKGNPSNTRILEDSESIILNFDIVIPNQAIELPYHVHQRSTKVLQDSGLTNIYIIDRVV